MEIIINGEPKQTSARTVAELLRELSIEGGRVAVEVNLQVIGRRDFGEAALKAGDAVEIVNFVGGG